MGAVARQLLRSVGTDVVSHVIGIGAATVAEPLALTFEQVRAISAESALHCASAHAAMGT